MSVLRTLVSYISFPGMYVVSCHKKIPAVSINRVSSDIFTLLQINKDFKRRFWHLIYNKGHDLTRERREECLVYIKDVRRRELRWFLSMETLFRQMIANLASIAKRNCATIIKKKKKLWKFDRVKKSKNVTLACYGPLRPVLVRKETKTDK